MEIWYTKIIKPFFFLFPADTVHLYIVRLGEFLGNIVFCKALLSFFFLQKHPSLEQDIAGVHFASPVGLAAGFDYEGRLTQILPSLGFGFATVGTLTNLAYDGNPRPMLGRLPKSQSLMVNKGFKNVGAKKTLQRMRGFSFVLPVGMSIGRSNNPLCNTQEKSIADIVKSFTFFEKSTLPFSYYELNISCPNLFGSVTFYPTKNLQELLFAIKKLSLRKPLFIKMPIDKSHTETLQMLAVIAKFPFVTGVIFGNLQKNRKDTAFDKNEVKRFSVGNFSGKPTFERSNELIRLTYRKYKNRFIIIGTGGIFSAEDAYTKIKLGASLVQLITGLVYKGPQLVAQINSGLSDLLEKDGLSNISEVIGKDA